MHQEYAEAPETYAAPQVNRTRAAQTGDSGRVQVGGYFFNWNTIEGGFTDSSWYIDNGYKGGPLVHYGFKSDQEVINYLNNMADPNLNAVFSSWSNWYLDAGETGLEDYENFANQIPYGCRTLD